MSPSDPLSPVEVQEALAAADPVRERVLRQLVESLIYEGALSDVQDGANAAFAPTGRADTTITPSACSAVDAAGRIGPFTVPWERSGSFDRVRLTGPVTRDGAPVSIAEFLADAPIAADPACLARFTDELARTVLHDALAQHRRPSGPLDPDAGHDRLEALIVDGHRYHPAYKSRVGFSVDDDVAHGPEFAPTVRPVWLGVDPALASVSGDGVRALWDAQFPGGVPDGRIALPVHPWQWAHVAAAACGDALADGRVTVLGEDGHHYRPQASIRTLACVDAPRLPSPKLSLSITNTSTSRGLAPYTVRNAPLVSAWLAGLVEGDPVLRDKARVILLREVAGTSVELGAPGALGCIWRESLHTHLHPAERAVPFPGLAARSAEGVPLIDPWIRAQGARGWVERMVTATVLPLVHLLVVHGVALESHAQNLLLVHAGGLPTRVALKDFHDGVRFSRPLLSAPAPAFEAPPASHGNANSFLETEDPALVTGFLLDALCFVALSEVAFLLADDYAFPEAAFWDAVVRVIRDHAERVPAFAARLATFDVFAPTLAVEELTTRRLWPDTTLRVHHVPNALARM